MLINMATNNDRQLLSYNQRRSQRTLASERDELKSFYSLMDSECLNIFNEFRS